MAGYVERLSRAQRVRSSAGMWCQRLAYFAVPFFLIVVVGHRIGALDTNATFWLLGLGLLIILAAILAGLRGFYELWTFGYEAGLRAARGTALALILLTPFAYVAAQAFILPPLYDVTTDLDEPPAFETALDDRSNDMNPILDPTESLGELQVRAYPRIAARRYPLGTGQVFRAVVALVGERDWTILTANTEQGQAPIDEEGSGLVAKPVTDAAGKPLRLPLPVQRPKFRILVSDADDNEPAFEPEQVAPKGRDNAESDNEQDERYVEAVATSFLFGFESDVVVRLVEEEEGTLVDMRSVSRWGSHDLGSNADRIMEFLSDLDSSLHISLVLFII